MKNIVCNNEGLGIIFLIGVALISTFIGIVMNNITLVFTGVAVILLTTVLLLGINEQFGKTLRSYIQ